MKRIQPPLNSFGYSGILRKAPLFKSLSLFLFFFTLIGSAFTQADPEMSTDPDPNGNNANGGNQGKMYSKPKLNKD